MSLQHDGRFRALNTGDRSQSFGQLHQIAGVRNSHLQQKAQRPRDRVTRFDRRDGSELFDHFGTPQ